MLDIINRGHADVCPLTGVILIMVVLGRLIATERQKMCGVVFGIVGFLVYGGYALQEFSPKDGEHLFSIALRSLIVFGLVVGLSWLVLPLVVGAATTIWRRMREASAAADEEYQRIQQQWEAEDRQRKEAEEWARSAPAREKAQEEAEAKAKEDAAIRKRKEDARAACIFLYEQQAHLVGPRLAKESFEEMLKQFLGDHQPVEEVERRAIQLQNLILGHAQQLDPATKKLPKAEIEEARAEVTRYYDSNKELLKDVYPPELFQSYLRLHMASNLEPEACWLACHKLIGRLQKLVERERESKKKQDERQRAQDQERNALTADIEECKMHIDQLRASGKQPDVVDHEIMELTAQLRHLEKQLQLLDERTKGT